MEFAHYIKEIGRGTEGSRSLGREDAAQLYGAMLDGGIPDLELGAVLLALRMKTESAEELAGFHSAAENRIAHLRRPPGELRPVVIPSYNGARHQPNLTPLLALLLARFRIPVLLHSTLEGYGRVSSPHVLRELGIMPCTTVNQAQQALEQDCLAFVPTAVLSPGLSTLLSLRQRLGLRNSAHTVVKLLDPFRGGALRIVSATHPAYLDNLREFLLDSGATALLLRGTEGEPYANSRRRPQLELARDGTLEILFEAEMEPVRVMPNLPGSIDAATTAAWTRQALAGRVPLPMPLVNQLACCLYATGYAEDMNQAKAIAAVQTGSLAA